VHAAADWDWELAAVTLVPLFCAVGLVCAADGQDDGVSVASRYGRPARLVGGLIVLSLGAFTVISLLGNSAVSASTNALKNGNVKEAQSEARSAMTWLPWSAEPWRRLGEAQYQAGQLGAARVSFNRALAKEPNDWTLWLELGLASRGPDQRAAWLEAARLNPDDAYIYNLRNAKA
jgi:Flp pilus assembly protein TadD